MRKFIATALGFAAMMLGPSTVTPTGAAQGSAYDFEFAGIDNKPVKLADWKGKAILIVNTASFCGYTKQYSGLQELWSTYEAKGLVVLGVPSNDFGEQEPKAEGEIKKFCEGAFGVTFPLTAKQVVTGEGAHPFYKWVTAAAGAPKWNFHKYLIGRDGTLRKAFASPVTPMSQELTGAIDAALAH